MTDQDPIPPASAGPSDTEAATDAAPPATTPLEAAPPPTSAVAPESAPPAPESAPPQAAPAMPPVQWQAEPSGQRRTFEVPGAPGVFFAGMWPRFAAWFVDGILLAIVGGIIGAALGSNGFSAGNGARSFSAVGAIVGVVVSAAYFIGLWRTSARATLGQRLLSIQVGNAFDGQTLTPRQAAIRWAALGYPLGLLSVTAATAGIGSLLIFVLNIVLFVTTLGSPTRQGWHDQVANTAVVVRPGASTSTGLAVAIVLGAFLILIVLGVVVGLAFIGSQMPEILSQIGKSV